MASAPDDTTAGGEIPDICPGREIGWIFKDGDAQTIERRGRPRDEGDEFPLP